MMPGQIKDQVAGKKNVGVPLADVCPFDNTQGAYRTFLRRWPPVRPSGLAGVRLGGPGFLDAWLCGGVTAAARRLGVRLRLFLRAPPRPPPRHTRSVVG